MMNWIEGQWTDGFKCLVQHDGVFDARAMAYETEELWFDEWEHGGPYFEVPEEYEKWNPVNHVAKWKTPMLVITREKDFRIRSEEHTSELQSLMRISYAVFCLKTKTTTNITTNTRLYIHTTYQD